MRHTKYRPRSLVLLRQLDSNGKVATIWGGEVITSAPKELTLLAIEMVYQAYEWHAVGEFQEIKAPPHRLPYKWDFPRLLVKFEANDIDLGARPVIETALQLYRQAPPSIAGEGES
jgi:hypothetical protein